MRRVRDAKSCFWGLRRVKDASLRKYRGGCDDCDAVGAAAVCGMFTCLFSLALICYFLLAIWLLKYSVVLIH